MSGSQHLGCQLIARWFCPPSSYCPPGGGASATVKNPGPWSTISRCPWVAPDPESQVAHGRSVFL